MKKSGLWIAIAVIAFMGLVVYSTLGMRKHRVEVCMEFNGQTSCRTAAGETVDRARRAAIDNACATIASGVGDSIACQNRPPVSEKRIE
ncbi:MAG: hypothetical protein IT167_19925 [Bryobacterales bacterium]|nr:hypothetical protein [Bryobacterales bacterium]MCZ2149546.1 hypothetical protein [Bryobacterales bacterium]